MQNNNNDMKKNKNKKKEDKKRKIDDTVVFNVKFKKFLGNPTEQPDWEALNIAPPDGTFETYWKRKAINRFSISQVDEVDDKISVIYTYDGTFIIGTGFKEAVKLIFNKKI